jgi:hypothetical protein
LRSYPISDPNISRIRRAISDPYGLGIALLAGIATLALHWPAAVAAGTLLAVVAVRVGSEFVVPRGARLELADAVAHRERQVRAALAEAEALVRGRAPAEVQSRVTSIKEVVLDIVARQATLEGASPQLFAVLRTATDYLPTAVETYMKLPAGWATTRRQADGRTALEILTSQLDLLHDEMVDVADAVNRNDIDKLLTHERFLTQRFGRSPLELRGDQESGK